MNHDEILTNRAARTDAAPEEVHCAVCDEPLVFGMRDKHHEFSVGLLTILECLNQAEEKGFVPELPPAWWSSLHNAYGKDFKPL